MRIIPAIDILGGKCVRLEMGNYNAVTTYNSDPVDEAKKFEAYGFKYLHLVDLDGAREKHIVNHKILESICTETKLSVDFGGGIKSDEDIGIAFESGAYSATIGSVAVNDRKLFLGWLDKYGENRIILGADSRDRRIQSSGWTAGSEMDIVEFITGYFRMGVKYVTCTDISKDGMLQGPSVQLYREILSSVKVSLIASGGITSLEDVKKLDEAGCEGAIIGKAIYEGRIDIKKLSGLC